MIFDNKSFQKQRISAYVFEIVNTIRFPLTKKLYNINETNRTPPCDSSENVHHLIDYHLNK